MCRSRQGTYLPLPIRPEMPADRQARCSMDAMLTPSGSFTGQAHLDPKFTSEQVASCRRPISGAAKNNQTKRLMWMREKLSMLGCAGQTKERRNETHVEQAEHRKPSRESKVDRDLPGVTATMPNTLWSKPTLVVASCCLCVVAQWLNTEISDVPICDLDGHSSLPLARWHVFYSYVLVFVNVNSHAHHLDFTTNPTTR